MAVNGVKERLEYDNQGKILMPTNIDGNFGVETTWFTTEKTVGSILMALGTFVTLLWLSSIFAGWVFHALVYTALILGNVFFIRYVILQEKYYFRLYTRLKQVEITTPAIWWNISSVEERNDMAILTYVDLKIGIVIRLERESIVGRGAEFKEDYYNALSELYKGLNMSGYEFVQMNIMERGINDTRLEQLENLIAKQDNENVKKLIEYQISHIKNLTRASLYEIDYLLVYTRDVHGKNKLIDNIGDILHNIIGMGFNGYKILNNVEIAQLVRDEYYVSYFKHTEATNHVFSMNNKVSINKIFSIVEIKTIEDNKIKIDRNIEKAIIKEIEEIIEGEVVMIGREIDIIDRLELEQEIEYTEEEFEDELDEIESKKDKYFKL